MYNKNNTPFFLVTLFNKYFIIKPSRLLLHEHIMVICNVSYYKNNTSNNYKYRLTIPIPLYIFPLYYIQN